jgi:signal transduction histidine kinase
LTTEHIGVRPRPPDSTDGPREISLPALPDAWSEGSADAASAADREIRGHPFAGTLLARRRTTASELAILGAALVVAAVAATAIGTGDLVSSPTGFATLVVSTLVAYVIAGLAWRRARPWSPLGPQLIAFGFFCTMTSLDALSSPVAHSIGVLAEAPITFFLVWLVLAFPSGRLDRISRIVVAAVGAVLVFGFVARTLLAPMIQPMLPLARCAGACPANPLQVAHNATLVSFAHWIDTVGRVGVFAVVLWILAYRFVLASHPRRRILMPVYLVAALLSLAAALNQISVNWLGVHIGPDDPRSVAFGAAWILFPFGFIASIVLAYVYVGAALASMVRELGVSTTVVGIERAVQRVLDDPRARLAFWLPRSHAYVDRHGRDIQLEELDTATWRRFERSDGEPLVAIVHDAALEEDPELVEAVGAETVLALENQRLQQDLLDSIAALRASRKRLVAAASAERRKIERDLHDSAQQMLIAVRIQLELARGQAAPESKLDGQLGRIGDDLDRALDELRSVAHGIYPPLLADEGLVEALAEAAGRAGIPVRLELEDVGRLPEEIETAVYYCCLEALQNAAKHGGDDVTVTLRLWWEPRLLRFSVADDGVGFMPGEQADATGLTNMLDRLGAIGGRISIRSAPGRGTDVDGAVTVSA